MALPFVRVYREHTNAYLELPASLSYAEFIHDLLSESPETVGAIAALRKGLISIVLFEKTNPQLQLSNSSWRRLLKLRSASPIELCMEILPMQPFGSTTSGSSTRTGTSPRSASSSFTASPFVQNSLPPNHPPNVEPSAPPQNLPPVPINPLQPNVLPTSAGLPPVQPPVTIPAVPAQNPASGPTVSRDGRVVGPAVPPGQDLNALPPHPYYNSAPAQEQFRDIRDEERVISWRSITDGYYVPQAQGLIISTTDWPVAGQPTGPGIQPRPFPPKLTYRNVLDQIIVEPDAQEPMSNPPVASGTLHTPISSLSKAKGALKTFRQPKQYADAATPHSWARPSKLHTAGSSHSNRKQREITLPPHLPHSHSDAYRYYVSESSAERRKRLRLEFGKSWDVSVCDQPSACMDDALDTEVNGDVRFTSHKEDCPSQYGSVCPGLPAGPKRKRPKVGQYSD